MSSYNFRLYSHNDCWFYNKEMQDTRLCHYRMFRLCQARIQEDTGRFVFHSLLHIAHFDMSSSLQSRTQPPQHRSFGQLQVYSPVDIGTQNHQGDSYITVHIRGYRHTHPHRCKFDHLQLFDNRFDSYIQNYQVC